MSNPFANLNARLKHDDKVDFIIAHYPQALKSNPYVDVGLIKTIKFAMFEVGLYSKKQNHNCANIDSAIIRYVIKAQKRKAAVAA